MMSKRNLGYAAFLGILISGSSLAQDSEVTNYKTGINLNYQAPNGSSGVRGTDFAEEYLYWDKLVTDRKVIYVHDDTRLVLSHNDRNVAGLTDGSDDQGYAATSVGVIEYRVDGDLNWIEGWCDYPEYTAPLTFANLTYAVYGAPGVRVLGSVGYSADESQITLANKRTHYWRGHRDAAGNEIHTIQVADDDTARTTNPEAQTSDGREYIFVVNPKTPCLTWRVSGGGQFYTTPLKNYFLPRIYTQTTYIAPRTGGVSVEIVDINGGNISYRINGGTTVNVSGKSVTLTDSAFSNGSNTLEYWITATPSTIATRKVVKNPAYPSAGENHGDMLWGGSPTLFTNEVRPRVANNPTLSSFLNSYRTDTYYNAHTSIESSFHEGRRLIENSSSAVVSTPAFVNALVARWDGMTARRTGATMTYADYAKRALFEIPTTIDYVGSQNSQSNNQVPCREVIYRGYYDYEPLAAAAFAYDILIGYYREDQGYANGITPIEDYCIRDLMAMEVLYGLREAANIASVEYQNYDAAGMWDGAHQVAGFLIATVMPSYSTEHAGTSGFDGSSASGDGRWRPFRDLNRTWKQVFCDRSTPRTGYPNLDKRPFTWHFLLRPTDGQWNDRVGYSDSLLCGRALSTIGPWARMHVPDLDLSELEMFYEHGARGTLMGLKDNSGPEFRANPAVLNNLFPSIQTLAKSNVLSRSDSDNQGLARWIQRAGPTQLLWFDAVLPTSGSGETPPVAPSSLTLD